MPVSDRSRSCLAPPPPSSKKQPSSKKLVAPPPPSSKKQPSSKKLVAPPPPSSKKQPPSKKLVSPPSKKLMPGSDEYEALKRRIERKPSQDEGKMPRSDGVICLEYEVEAVKRKLELMIRQDDVEMFLKTIRQYDSLQLRDEGQHLLIEACVWNAFKCATAILSGETSFSFDVNKATNDCRAYPIHCAASNCCPGMIELLLYHGASADVQCEFYSKELNRKRFPLYCAAVNASIRCIEPDMYGWTRGDSVFKLVFLICLQKFQEDLECVELLACKASTFQDQFLQYAKEGALEFIAFLLAVARRKLTLSIGEIRELLSSSSSESGIAEGTEASLFLLFDVFEKAGEGLEACIKKNKNGVTARETSWEVATLLVKAGFSKNDVETDLSYFLCLDDDFFLWRGSRGSRSADVDVGMEHYGTSGCRWGTYNGVQAAKEKKLKGKVIHRLRPRWVY